MPKTIKEIREEWKQLRASFGNLICHIDNKMNQMETNEQAYNKGFNDAIAMFDPTPCENCKHHESGANDIKYPCCFCSHCYPSRFEPKKPAKTNAEKFREVFGREIRCDLNLDKARRAFVIGSDNPGHVKQSEWLDEPYKEIADE